MNVRVLCLNNIAIQPNNLFSGYSSLVVRCLLVLGLLSPGLLLAQAQTFNASGSFTVPEGVTSITVQAWGAGGGGGNGSGKEGGGGGGAYASSVLSVTPGTVYTITVGDGGGEGVAGGPSSFGVLVIAAGGSSGSSDNGFNGGTVAASTGTTRFAGGSGGDTSGGTSGGGGGGGSATTSAAGNDGTNGGANAGIGGTGTGNGGNGGDDDGNPAPQNGVAPGGGGGGSSSNNTSSGSGADGRVSIAWTCVGVNVTNFSTAASSPVCTGAASTVTLTSTTLADGTYTVYYNLSGANTANGQSASMTFSGVTGTFSTIALANSGATTITITSVGCADTETNNTASITVNTAPATPGAITGTASQCPATAGLAYSIAAVAGAASYTWTVPTGWSITAGQGTTGITVTSGSAGQSGNITVTATNACGTSGASTLAVSTVQDIGFNGDITADALTICVGTTGTTIDGGNPAGGETYTWQVSTSGAGGPFSTVSPNPGDVKDYTIANTYYNTAGTYHFRRVISGSGCNGNGDVVALTVNANPSATISVIENSGTANNGTVCNGTQVNLGVAAASSYAWAPGGATTQTIDVTPSATTTYTVTVTNSFGCTNTGTQVVTVNGVPTINAISASPSTICAGASSTLSVVAANNSTQSFSNNNTITIPNGGNASPFPSTITVSGLPTTGITVANVSFNNFSHEDPNDADIYLIGPNNQVIWIMSDAGGTTSVTNFDLTYADGGTALSTATLVSGTTYAPADLTAAETTPGGAALISNMAGFTGNMNGTWSLYVVDDDNDTNSGDLEGWTITFNTPNYTYLWSNGPTTASQPVTPAMTTAYTVTVTVPGTGCSSTSSVTVTVNIPSCSISGADPVCANTTGHVYSAPMGMSNYAWSIAGNGSIPGATNGQTVSVNAGAAGTYTVTLTVTESGCTSSCSKTVTVNALPTAVISGTLSFCTGSSTTLTASGGSSYLWDDASTSAMRVITAGGTYTV
ncbi:MAG: hypothetical protein IT260_14470, partial [Saprospiraceae bacterium]|nr:hypothetical protein [Saprospiraceae bacterium]